MVKTQVEPWAAGERFHCKVLNINFYGIISMVYKSVDHEKLWSICFLQWHLLFYEKPKTKQPALCDMLYHVHGLYSHRP